MKRTLFVILAAVVLGGMLASCQQSKYPGYKETQTGLYYKFFTDVDDTLFPKLGDFVEIDMKYGTKDSTIFDSKNLQSPMQLPVVESVYPGDIYEGMMLMNEGDSAGFICNTDSVFTKLFRLPEVPEEFKNEENIYFYIKMKDIMSKEEMDAKVKAEMQALADKETGDRDAYIKEHYPDAQPTESGLYYIIVEEGNGPKPQAGDKVKVHYTGTFLDGTKFDSSVDRGQPFEFTLGKGQVIRGWDEGIAMMRKGGKAVLIIPSDLGYGPQGNRGIPPSSTLVLEVELIDFVKE